jgi:hypothetical protein
VKSHDPAASPYRPFYFAQQFDYILEQSYSNPGCAAKTDEQGFVWRLQQTYKVLKRDLSKLGHLGEETTYMRKLQLRHHMRNWAEFRGVERLYAHGWAHEKKMDYTVIVEEPYSSLQQLAEEEARCFYSVGTSTLVAARVLSQVLESAGKLFQETGQIITTLRL